MAVLVSAIVRLVKDQNFHTDFTLLNYCARTFGREHYCTSCRLYIHNDWSSRNKLCPILFINLGSQPPQAHVWKSVTRFGLFGYDYWISTNEICPILFILFIYLAPQFCEQTCLCFPFIFYFFGDIFLYKLMNKNKGVQEECKPSSSGLLKVGLFQLVIPNEST